MTSATQSARSPRAPGLRPWRCSRLRSASAPPRVSTASYRRYCCGPFLFRARTAWWTSSSRDRSTEPRARREAPRRSSPIASGGRVTAWDVTATFFPLLGARPLLGRAFIPDEDRPVSSPVAVLSHDFWMSRFGGDPHVLGRGITLDTTSYTIVGVMPGGFHYPPDASLWRNLGAALSGPAGQQHARDFGCWVVGRLRTDATLTGARAELD